jgi:hypothetical protein
LEEIGNIYVLQVKDFNYYCLSRVNQNFSQTAETIYSKYLAPSELLVIFLTGSTA